MYRIINFIPILFLFSLLSLYSNNTKNYYILNTSLPYNISNNQIEALNVNSNNNFRMMLELIGICVTNYFIVFNTLFKACLNVILICVTNYFITFNNLFMGSLNFIKDCIVNSYLYSYSILQLFTDYPTNYLIFIYFITQLYLDIRNRPR